LKGLPIDPSTVSSKIPGERPVNTSEGIKAAISEAYKKGDMVTVKKLQKELEAIDPMGAQRIQIQLANLPTPAPTGTALDDMARAIGTGIAPLTSVAMAQRVPIILRMQALGLRVPSGIDAQKIMKNASSGLRAINKMEEMLRKNPRLLVYAAVPGALGARVFATARKEAADVITRLRTGAALNEDEQTFYSGQMPTALDLTEPQNIWDKLDMYRQLFTDLAGQSGNEQPASGKTRKVFNPVTGKVEER
jgi:hypothetical protein